MFSERKILKCREEVNSVYQKRKIESNIFCDTIFNTAKGGEHEGEEGGGAANPGRWRKK